MEKKNVGRMNDILILPHDAEVKFMILHAVTKPINNITVKEICENSHISKRTFYNHFQSKYDILPWFLDLTDTFFARKIGVSYSMREGLLKTYDFIYQENKFLTLSTYFMSDQETGYGMHWKGWSSTYVNTLREIKKVSIDRDIKNLIYGYTNIQTLFTLRWINDGFQESPEELVDMILEFIPERFIQMFNLT